MDKSKAWSAYWAQMGGAGGCLPGAPPVVEAQLAQLWGQFAQGFTAGAKLLDLACGTGAVMRSMLRGNDALDLTGVDYADLPRSQTKKIRFIGKTDIAKLPFEAASFDGLTSQYGVEYGDIATSAPEMARVARPGAQLCFVIHHADSPIVEQNGKRNAALNAIAQSAIFNMSRAAIAQPETNIPLLSQAFSFIARGHPDQTVVREIAAGVDHAIRIGGKKGPPELERIESNLAQESAVLEALLTVALNERGIGAFVETLSGDFQCDPVTPIQPQGMATPIAWQVCGTRKS